VNRSAFVFLIASFEATDDDDTSWRRKEERRKETRDDARPG